jgi:DNA-binding CsgD family transcriptional regulator
MLAGDFAKAESTALAFREVGAQTQDFAAGGLFYAFMLALLQKTGRFGDYPDIHELGNVVGDMPIVQAQFGLYALNTGDRDSALSMYGRLRPGVRAGLPHESRWLPTIVCAAELAIRLGDRDTAQLCHGLMLPFAGLYLNSTTSVNGAVARTAGWVAGELGRHDEAVRHLEAAVTMEEHVGALPDLAIAQVALATALAARGEPGDRHRAGVLAESALHTSQRLGMAPARASAAALADELAGVRPGAAGALTAREREVAALVAAGMANRAIAESLVLSERTVETHVRNVLTKLGLANRTQVAGWAVRAGLTHD